MAFQIQLLHPFQVLYNQLLCKQCNLGINLLNVLVFHFQNILGIEPKVLLHSKDHRIICNLLKLLFLLLHILGMVYNVLVKNQFLYNYIRILYLLITLYIELILHKVYLIHGI